MRRGRESSGGRWRLDREGLDPWALGLEVILRDWKGWKDSKQCLCSRIPLWLAPVYRTLSRGPEWKHTGEGVLMTACRVQQQWLWERGEKQEAVVRGRPCPLLHCSVSPPVPATSWVP